VLAVGAGGIGCKTLVMSGFKHIKVVRYCCRTATHSGYTAITTTDAASMPSQHSLYISAQQIDRDSIETSNLSRQFLFRKRHVGHRKSLVPLRR
jgi:molybdopterin/thiamine biosynthesis adenylyltransferase